MDPTQAPPAPPGLPGHYGPGYGEVPPEGSTPDPAVTVPAEADPERTGATTPASPSEPAASADVAPDAEQGRGAAAATGSDGEPVVFTADDVTARPPDHPPTEHAPESEKAGLIFERS